MRAGCRQYIRSIETVQQTAKRIRLPLVALKGIEQW